MKLPSVEGRLWVLTFVNLALAVFAVTGHPWFFRGTLRGTSLRLSGPDSVALLSATGSVPSLALLSPSGNAALNPSSLFLDNGPNVFVGSATSLMIGSLDGQETFRARLDKTGFSLFRTGADADYLNSGFAMTMEKDGPSFRISDRRGNDRIVMGVPQPKRPSGYAGTLASPSLALFDEGGHEIWRTPRP